MIIALFIRRLRQIGEILKVLSKIADSDEFKDLTSLLQQGEASDEE
jgi:hypothetical protein